MVITCLYVFLSDSQTLSVYCQFWEDKNHDQNRPNGSSGKEKHTRNLQGLLDVKIPIEALFGDTFEHAFFDGHPSASKDPKSIHPRRWSTKRGEIDMQT